MVQKVRAAAVNSYGFVLFAWGLLFAMNTSYWAFFMTDVAKMPVTLMATVLLVSNIVDWCMVPVAGILLQKLHPKYVKYRTWLLIAPTVVAVCFVFMFINPAISMGAKAVLYGGAYCLQTVFQSLMFGTLNTLVPLLGKRQEERAAFSARKAQGNQLGKIAVGLIALPLILAINGGDKAGAPGYLVATIIFGVTVVCANLIMYRFSKEADAEAVVLEQKGEKLPILEMFKIFFTNLHLLSAVLADSTRYIAQFIVWGLSMYYFSYVLKNLAYLPVFFTTMSVVGFFGAILGEFLAKKLDKKTVYMMGLGILALAHLANYFISKDPITYIVIISIGYFGVSWANANAIALQSDGAVYSEWKSGKEVKGFIMAMCMVVPKIANIVNGIVIGFGLAAIGYVAGQDMTPEMMSGMTKLINLIPAAFLCLGILLLYFFNKLTVDKMKEIQADLQARMETVRGNKEVAAGKA